MARDAKVEKLSAVPLFRACSERELEHVARVTDEVRFSRGQVLMREGERGQECLVLVDGDVIVTIGGVEVARIGAGETAGELALVTARTRSATATAATDGTAYVIGVREFDSLLAEVPSVTRAVLREVADRLVAADARL